MKKKKKQNSNYPIISGVNKDLDKYLEMDLFKEKIERVKEIIEKAELPKTK